MGLVLSVVLLVAGCSSVAGEPTPAAEPAVELPPRPRELRLDGVDPCSLLTEAQRAELGLDARPVFDLSPSQLYPGGDVPTCVIGGFEPRAVTVALSVVTTTGIELFTAGELAADVSPIEVHSYPAVLAVPTRSTDWCTVILDVAQGQLLDIQYADGGREPAIPQTDLCRDAKTVAEAVMSTMLDGQ